MPPKSAKPDDREQSKRFIETAKEVGADEDAEALERAFKRIVPQKRGASQKGSWSLACRSAQL
jgi:hypothetical protein